MICYTTAGNCKTFSDSKKYLKYKYDNHGEREYLDTVDRTWAQHYAIQAVLEGGGSLLSRADLDGRRSAIGSMPLNSVF